MVRRVLFWVITLFKDFFFQTKLCFRITPPTILYTPPVSVLPSVRSSFPDNSSYSFHRIALKHGEQFDYEVMQHILFRDYSTSTFDSCSVLKIIQAWFPFVLTPPLAFTWSSCYLLDREKKTKRSKRKLQPDYSTIFHILSRLQFKKIYLIQL